MIDIQPLAAVAPSEVEALLDAAFGPDRHGRTAYKLRAGMAAVPALSFAAFDRDLLAGLIQCWPAALTDDAGTAHPVILLGPVAVRPDHQRDGIGRLLMTETLHAWHEMHEAEPLVLIGDPEYYGRFFGFSAASTGGWRLPGPFEPRRLLALMPSGATLPASGDLGPRLA